MEKFALPSMYELCLMHARADRAMRAVVSEQVDSQGLTMMQWLALGVISTAPKVGFSMSQIAVTLDVTLPQVTALVATLLKMKLVKQRILHTDRRGRQVLITPRGRRTLLKLETKVEHAMTVWTEDIPATRLKAYLLTVSELASKPD